MPASRKRQSTVGTEESRQKKTASVTTDSLVLDELSQSESSYVRQEVARNSATASSTLSRLVDDPVEYVLLTLARNVNLFPDDVRKLSKSSFESVRRVIAYRDDVAEEILVELSRDPSVTVRKVVSWHKKTPQSVWLALATDPVFDVRKGITYRGNYTNSVSDFPPEVVDALINGNEEQRRRASKLSGLSHSQMRQLLSDSEERVRVNIVKSSECPTDLLVFAAHDSNMLVMHYLTSRTNLPHEALQVLATRDVSIQTLMTRIPYLPDDVKETLVTGRSAHIAANIYLQPGGKQWCEQHPNPKVRRVAAHHVNERGTFFDACLADESELIRETIVSHLRDPELARYADDPSTKVRVVLASLTRDPHLLLKFARDARVPVRRAALMNPAVTAEVLTILADDPHEKLREDASAKFFAAVTGTV